MKVFEVNGTTLCLALFVDVTNSKELLDLMQAGTLEPEVAPLNALLIPNVFPVLAAAHKTLVAKSLQSLTTWTLHSELVYNYSGSKHISESLKDAASPRVRHTSLWLAMEKLIKGRELDLDDLEGRANQSQIQKHYKISILELGISSLADAITCNVAARDAL